MSNIINQSILSTDKAKETYIDELFQKLSSSKNGLSSSEAEKRLQQYGPNEIPEKKINPIIKFLSYFWGHIPWMIEAAIIHTTDCYNNHCLRDSATCNGLGASNFRLDICACTLCDNRLSKGSFLQCIGSSWHNIP